MPNGHDLPRGGPRLNEKTILVRVPAHNHGVRECVAVSTAFLTEIGGSDEDVTAIELAVAEIMNNVVEHAYENTAAGLMTLEIVAAQDEINFKVVDQGKPMPQQRLPSGNPADTSLQDFEQEEGGYGLFMIRQLAKKLRYARVGDENHLTFRMNLGATHHWDSDVAV